MRIKTVPHTLIRGRIYYYNLRFQEHFIRISLKTSQAHIAFQCVIKINDFLLAYKQLGVLTKELVVSVVKKVRDQIISNVNAYLGLDSTTQKEVLDSYSTYYAEAEQDYRNSKLFYPPEEISHLKPKTFEEYQLDKVFPHNKKADELAQSSVESDFMLENELSATSPYIDDIIYENSKALSWIKDVSELTLLYKSASRIRRHLENGEQSPAVALLNAINGDVVAMESSNRSKLKPFSDYVPLFLEAGQKGKLGTLRNRKSRGKWTDKNYKSTKDHMQYICAFLKGKSLDDVSGLDLDELFKELLPSLPKRNVLPFSKMNIEEIVQATINGEVDDNQLISFKTVSNYKKVMQSFYRFILDKRYLTASPIDAMRHTIPEVKNERGPFQTKDISKIVQYCISKTKSEQKWPFLLMAYTGMRNGEIMQLRKQDVKECERSKLPYIEVSEAAGSVKTESSNRCIPIHSKLLEFGFLDFVANSETKIFKKSGRYLTYFYSNFIKRDLNLPDLTTTEKVLTLYSLRHSVATQLTAHDVVLTKVQQILGHSVSGSITEKYYIDKVDLESLKSSIELLNY